MKNIESFMKWATFNDEGTDFARLLVWQAPDTHEYVAQLTDGEYVLLDENADKFMHATGATAALAIANLDKKCAAVMKRVDKAPESV